MSASDRGSRAGARSVLRGLALAGISVTLTLVAVELVMRGFPHLLPSGSYGAGRYDPELQMNTHGGPTFYNRGRLVRKTPNRAGFMDVEHAREKPAGTLRVGFFGDSYVEALQVPTEETFFRVLPEHLGGMALEPLAFGMSGWGTLHALVTSRVEAPRYDLDVVVYVFVENDPGDNSYRVQKQLGLFSSAKPYADLPEDGDGFEIAWLSPPGPPSLSRRVAKFVQSHSLLAQMVWNRVYLLRNRGIAVGRDQAAEEMSERSEGRPDPNALPSTWPPAMRAHVERLGERLIARFARESAEAGRHFTVLYVPRGEAQLRGEIALADTWRPWLGRVCREHAIPLVDPSDALRERLARGETVYDDHFAPAGHRAVAEAIAAHLRPLVAARTAG